MKRFLLWSFERGSVQYDVICLVILLFIFITPQAFFDDRPDFMRIRSTDQAMYQAKDDDGNPVYVVPKVKTEQDAVDQVKLKLGQTVTISHTQPVYDSYGMLVQYAIWVAR